MAISAGNSYTCALTNAGAVRCWGRMGNISYGNTPANVAGLGSGVAQISSGGGDGGHACALTTGGAMKCWGWNGSGQVGHGTTGGTVSTPVDVSGLGSSVTAISAGGGHSCAVTTAGEVACWGSNWVGQLGTTSVTDHSNVPVTLTGLGGTVAAISSGQAHTCVRLTSGAMQCWGWNERGQVGNTSEWALFTPTNVSGLGSGVLSIGTGYEHSCAITTSGTKCWGSNYHGQIGDGSTAHRRTPVTVANLGAVTSIGGGGLWYGTNNWSHTCAVTTSGSVKCWGANHYGQLGDATIEARSLPDFVLVPDPNHIFSSGFEN